MAYTYDADGNLTGEYSPTDRSLTTYTYTVENRLEAVYTGTAYSQTLQMAAAYDGDGNRVYQLNYNPDKDEDLSDYYCTNNFCDYKGTGIRLQAEGEVSPAERELLSLINASGAVTDSSYELIEYINDVNREYTEVLVEQNINGTLDTAYVYGAAIGIGSDRLSLDRFDSSTGYYLYDPKGSVTGIINEEGQIYQSYRYSVFGEITFGASEYENEYTYNGESYNPNIKSQYLRARYYCVVTADFLTEDTCLGNIREPLTLNRYNYCVGNPVKYADPSGQFITAVGGAIIGAIGGFIIGGVDFAISAYNTKKSGGEIDWYDGITGILNATATGAVGGGVLGATGNPLLAAAAGGATYGFLNSTAEVAKSGELNTESALHVADETLKGSFISTTSTATFMSGMAVMEPVAIPAVAKLFVAGSGAGVTSTFVDATIEGRKVTNKEILMSGLKGGFDTLIVSGVASAYEYRSYAKWQKTAPSVKAVTERANNTIKSETCEGGKTSGSRFPEDPNDLFPDDYAGLTKVEKPDGKIDFIVEAGDKTYKIEYHPKHEGDGHYDGNHYHVLKLGEHPKPGKTKPPYFRIPNLDPDTPAQGGTFAPGDLLPTKTSNDGGG